jgi:hypothetical protein
MAATSLLGESLRYLRCVYFLRHSTQRHPYSPCRAPQFRANTIHSCIPLRVCCKRVIHRTSVFLCLSHMLSSFSSSNYFSHPPQPRITASLPPLSRPTRHTRQRRHRKSRLQEAAHRIPIPRSSITGGLHGHPGEGMTGVRGK